MENNNHQATPSAADIVSSALNREGIYPAKMSGFGVEYLLLTKGRPHINVGLRTLLEHPSAILLAVWQAAFMYAFVYDAAQFLHREHNTIWLHHIPRGAWFGVQWLDAAVFFFLAASVPFFVLNLGWGLMAAAITGRWRPSILLSGLSGLVPLRFVAPYIMPKWWFFRVEYRLDMSLAARILQFSWAYKLATGRSRAEIEMDWARALDRHTKPLLDGLLSYAIQPILVLFILVPLVWVMPLNMINAMFDWMFNYLQVSPNYLEEFIIPYFSIIALMGSWMAFERACLGAMVFRYLTESAALRTPQTRGIRFGILAMICAIAAPLAFSWEYIREATTKDLPAPISGAIWTAPELYAKGQEYYGAAGLIVPSSENGYFYVVLENKEKRPVTKLFLRPGDTHYFPVPAGEYTIKAYHGYAWRGMEYIFGFGTQNVIGGKRLAVCPHYRLKHLDQDAVGGPMTRLCYEHRPPNISREEFDKLNTETVLLCGPKDVSEPRPSPNSEASQFITGADPREITCSMPVEKMGHSRPFGPVLETLTIPTALRTCCAR